MTLLLILVTPVFALNFSPVLLKYDAPSSVVYSFDGSDLSIPVRVSGKAASTFFLIYTKDKGQMIGTVKNGYLGWHYLNKVDSCLYVAGPTQLVVGSNTISWNGKTTSGETLSKGDYTYYLWGYDNNTMRYPMTQQINMYAWAKHTIVTHDQNGNPLDNPIVYVGYNNNSSTAETQHTNYKWVVGSDPTDASLVETCQTSEWNDVGGIAFLPGDYKYFFKCSQNNDHAKVIRKWEWVPNGVGVMQNTWGDQGQFKYSVAMPSNWDSGPGLLIKDNYLLTVNGNEDGTGTESQVIFLDISEGTELKRLDLSKWYVNVQDGQAGGQTDSGPNGWSIRYGKVVTNTFASCMNLMFNVDYENEEDAILWANGNGDYTGDHNFETNAKFKWVCNDYNVGPYKYNITMDDNMFSLFPAYDMGAVSFGLYAPDGTGLSYHAFAGETSGYKWSVESIDYNSKFDGLYTTNEVATAEGDRRGWFFIANDSFKGIISSQVAVVDAAPAAFTVAQNSPNPFNPTTTISFTLAKAGKTTVEVYNVAGQKIDTLVNATLSAGVHSTNWNAAKFSAGVYFYTVRSGEFSKTMKMTLLK